VRRFLRGFRTNRNKDFARSVSQHFFLHSVKKCCWLIQTLHLCGGGYLLECRYVPQTRVTKSWMTVAMTTQNASRFTDDVHNSLNSFRLETENRFKWKTNVPPTAHIPLYQKPSSNIVSATSRDRGGDRTLFAAMPTCCDVARGISAAFATLERTKNIAWSAARQQRRR